MYVHPHNNIFICIPNGITIVKYGQDSFHPNKHLASVKAQYRGSDGSRNKIRCELYYISLGIFDLAF